MSSNNSHSRVWALMYGADGLLHILAEHYALYKLSLVTKSMLMVLLMGFFISTNPKKYKVWVLLALVFSWFGDAFLLFQQVGSIYFMLGLGSFLLAHVFYIIRFQCIKTNFSYTHIFLISTLFLLYGVLLLNFLWLGLGGFKAPVVVYALVLVSMAVSAVVFTWQRTAFISIGAILFVVSDSLIAINKFWVHLPAGRVLIMGTYVLAQWLIITGILKLEKLTKNTNY